MVSRLSGAVMIGKARNRTNFLPLRRQTAHAAVCSRNPVNFVNFVRPYGNFLDVPAASQQMQAR
jgi:hypothetical protein